MMDGNAGQTLVLAVKGVLLTILRPVAPSQAGKKQWEAMETKYESKGLEKEGDRRATGGKSRMRESGERRERERVAGKTMDVGAK